MALPGCLLLLPYLIPRVLAWVALLGAALADAILHRHVKRRGYQLQRGVLIVICCFVVENVLFLAYSVTRAHSASAAKRVYLAYTFFGDTGIALFLGLLLMIAAGFCITRDNLGPYKLKVLLAPAVYWLTKVVSDYTYIGLRGSTDYDDVGGVVELSEDVSAIAFIFFCETASIAALLLAWVYIFDAIQRERERLENPREGIVNAVPRSDLEAAIPPPVHSRGGPGGGGGLQAAGRSAAGRGRGSGGPSGGGGGIGHEVDVPAEVLLDSSVPLSDVYAEVADNDTDEAKTVEDRLAHTAKARLLRQFMWGVGGYIIARTAAILLPLFLWSKPEQEDVAICVVYILESVVQWGFLAVLTFIFRLRADSPYLLLDDEPDGGGEGEPGLNTELGVLSSEHANGGPRAGPAARDHQGINRAFSLGEDEDEALGPPHGAAGDAKLPTAHAGSAWSAQAGGGGPRERARTASEEISLR